LIDWLIDIDSSTGKRGLIFCILCV
jgi:hypothetical protein